MTEMPRILTESQIQSYRERGYAFPIRVLDPTKAGQAVKQVEVLEGTYRGEDRDYVHRTLLRFKPHLLFTWLNEIIRTPRILDAVEDLIGPDILVWASAFFIKDARDPGFVAWHQDSITYGLDGNDLVTAWLALTDAHIENAAMKFLPASHKLGALRHIDTDDKNNVLSRHEVVDLQVDETRAVNVILDAGEMSLHHLDLLHCSPPNGSDRRRIGYAIRYLPPTMRHKYGTATAMLVRGKDSHGHFELEPEPRWENDARAHEAHARAMELRRRSVFASH